MLVRTQFEKLVQNYNSLLRIAGRDRAVVLACIDRIGLRLDDLLIDSDAARAKILAAFENYDAG